MYPNLYYAFKDLFGIDLPFLQMVQSFGFFVAMGFILFSYLLAKELQRKESQGLLQAHTIKVLKGAKATMAELVTSGIIGFVVGYKLLFIAMHFDKFVANTQGYILSLEGSMAGAIIGAIISAYMKYRESEKEKRDKPVLVEEQVYPHQLVGNITLIAAFTGILGAKIFHNLENWDEFMNDPIDALLSFSGLTVYGGLIVAAIAVIYYGKKNNIQPLHLIDAAAPVLMIGYGVGRIGCQVSGDGDWGIVNTFTKPNWLGWLPDWMWAYDYPHNVNSVGVLLPNCDWGHYCYHLEQAVFPTPFYETVISIVLFIVLWQLRTRITIPGMLFAIYLIFNGVERFFIEKIRVNNKIMDSSFTQAEFISVALILIGTFGIIYLQKRHSRTR
jgi:phosphatidylglycerol---prolipoprotein diacylglyceryl transferase